MTPATKLAQRLALGVPALLLAGAYISQYGFALYPCEMCWWQRYGHFAGLAFALLSTFAPPRRLWIALAALGIAGSGLIGAFHAGVEYGWWEGITTCAIPVSEGANALDAILNAPIVRCDVAPWSLFGISLAGFNALFSIATALAIFSLLREKRQP
tara:strand:- start:43 stop:510 length:468 start_codon:yes stop_codon:yes gene_type:complete